MRRGVANPTAGQLTTAAHRHDTGRVIRPLLLPFSPRYILLTIAFAGTAAFATAAWRAPENLPYFLLPLAFFGAFAILGIRDLTQRRHAILRNYPIAAHLRFILENIRPEMRQYFFESDKEGIPAR